MLRLFMVISLMISSLLMAGCGDKDGTASTDTSRTSAESYACVEDTTGNTICFLEKPERIVVLSASFLEPLHELGGNVIARPDSKTKMPDYAKDLESIGQVYQVDAEKIVSLTPDLVIANSGMNEKVAKLLNDNSIPTLVLDMKSYDDIRYELKVFGKVLQQEEAADKIIADMDDKVRAVQAKVPKDDHKRVAILHSTAQGLTLQLDGSIAGSIAKILGWENVAQGMTPLDKNPDAAPYSLETLVAQNPDIIFVTSMGSIKEIQKHMDDEMISNPAWQAIPAVANHRVYYLPQDMFLLSPGLHYPDAVEYMAKLIYPMEFN